MHYFPITPPNKLITYKLNVISILNAQKSLQAFAKCFRVLSSFVTNLKPNHKISKTIPNQPTAETFKNKKYKNPS